MKLMILPMTFMCLHFNHMCLHCLLSTFSACTHCHFITDFSYIGTVVPQFVHGSNLFLIKSWFSFSFLYYLAFWLSNHLCSHLCKIIMTPDIMLYVFGITADRGGMRSSEKLLVLLLHAWKPIVQGNTRVIVRIQGKCRQLFLNTT